MKQQLLLTDYQNILAQSQVLLSGKRGPRLLMTQDGCIIKLFPQRKWLSSNRLIPYANRFVKNAERLAQLDIASVQPIAHGKIKGTSTHFVKYEKLPGQDVRDILQNGSSINILGKIAHFVGRLHQQGVFFRGIHLGNILQQPNDAFALIDITSVKFKSKPLSLRCRKRNLQHLLDYTEDKPFFDKFGITQFLLQYFEQTDLTPAVQQRLQQQVS